MPRRRLSLIRLYKRVLKPRFHSVQRKSGLMSGAFLRRCLLLALVASAISAATLVLYK